MSEISVKTVKRLFAQSGNMCAFPGCNSAIIDQGGVVLGEICHIAARSVGGPRFDAAMSRKDRDAFENLILLCGDHHKTIDSKPETYTSDLLKQMKAVHEEHAGRPELASDQVYAGILINSIGSISIESNVGNIAIGSPGAILAQNLNIEARKSAVKVHPPTGTIGSDQRMARYIQHLINRYNEFASADRTRKTKFNYGAISKNIEHKFGSQWKLLPVEKFEPLSDYLKGRIDRTLIARMNASKGMKAYSSFEDFSNR